MNRRRIIIKDKKRFFEGIRNLAIFVIGLAGTMLAIIINIATADIVERLYVVIISIVFIIIFLIQAKDKRYSIVKLDKDGLTIIDGFDTTYYRWDEIININYLGVGMSWPVDKHYTIYFENKTKVKISYSAKLKTFIENYYKK